MRHILLSTALFTFSASSALAMSGVYIEPKIGWSYGQMNERHIDTQYSVPFPKGKLDTTKDAANSSAVGVGAAVGYVYDKWLIPLRMETEYLYRDDFSFNTYPMVDGDVSPASIESFTKSTTLLGNFYFDVPVTDKFAFFAGAGIGAALAQTHTSVVGAFDGTKESYAFSWMSTAGLSVSPVKWYSISLSYRYSDLGNLKARISSPTGPFAGGTDDFVAQEVYLGIRLLLPSMYNKPKAHTKHEYLDK